MSLSESDAGASRETFRLVLISGDSRSQAEVRRLLEGSPCEIIVANDPDAGCAEVDRLRPEAVLLEETPAGSELDLLPRLHKASPATAVIFAPVDFEGERVIQAVKRFAVDLLPRPYDPSRLRSLVNRAVVLGRGSGGGPLGLPDDAAPEGRELLGVSPAMQSLFKQIGRVAPLDTPVCVLGEQGTEREAVAATVHRHSSNAAGPFVTVNCGVHDAGGLEEELFGPKSVKEGEVSPGKIGEAAGGTLVLQEIEAAPQAVQMRLVAALREGHYRTGLGERLPFACRFVAIASDRLTAGARAGHFHPTLFYQLSACVLKLPPLRQRPSDLRLLVERTLNRLAPITLACGVGRPEISEEIIQAITSHFWPGNLDELECVLKRSLIEQRGRLRIAGELIAAIGEVAAVPSKASADTGKSVTDWTAFADLRIEAGGDTLHAEAIAETERKLFARVLRHTRGNQAQAARFLGITRASLRKKLRMYGMVAKQAGESDES